jgi:hypothetical protein
VGPGGPGGSLRKVYGTEMAGCPQRGRRGAPTLGARGAEKGKGDQQQSGSREGATGAQRGRQDSGCCKRGDSATRWRDSAARLGGSAAGLGAQKMPGLAADGMWRRSPGASMWQAMGVELEREEENIRGEWAVHVLGTPPTRNASTKEAARSRLVCSLNVEGDMPSGRTSCLGE